MDSDDYQGYTLVFVLLVVAAFAVSSYLLGSVFGAQSSAPEVRAK